DRLPATTEREEAPTAVEEDPPGRGRDRAPARRLDDLHVLWRSLPCARPPRRAGLREDDRGENPAHAHRSERRSAANAATRVTRPDGGRPRRPCRRLRQPLLAAGVALGRALD